MKKATYALALVAVSSLALAGCAATSSNDTSSSPKEVSGTVTQWIYPITTDQQDYWNSRVADFEKSYPKVNVKVVVQPWANRDVQLATAVSSDTAPDVVYLIPDQIPQYVQTGALADVSSLLSSDKSDYTAGSIEGVTVNGKQYGMPILQSVSSTLINTKAFADAGITSYPTTWAEVLKDAPKLKAAGYYTTQFSTTSSDTLNLSYYPLLWQAGGDVLNKAGTKATFDQSAGVDALTFMKQLIDGGYAPKEPVTTVVPPQNSPLAQGKVAMQFSMSSTDLAASGVSTTGWKSVPSLKDKASVAYGTVGALSELATTKNKAATDAWLNWLSTPKELKKFDLHSNYFSPRKSTGPLYASDPLLSAEEKQVSLTKPGVISVSSRQVMALIQPQIQAALLGKSSPADALKQAASDTDPVLSSGN